MHYQSDITSIDDKLWTRDEVERWLGNKFKGSDLLLCDDSFYETVNNKDQLIILAEKIKKRLKVRQVSSYKLSENLKAPGNCSINERKISLTLPVGVIGDPLKAAACLAHLYAHALLLLEKKQLIDHQENERFADIACLQAGLGIVMLNGANHGGWRTKVKKRSLEHSSVLGYFTVEQFSRQFVGYMEKRSIDPQKAARFTVSWLRKNISKHPIRRGAAQPYVLKNAQAKHRRSLHWYATILFVTTLLILSGIALTLRKPLTEDKQLTALRTQADELKGAYDACIKRYENLVSTLPDDQISSVRLLSYEQMRCKSFENHYNSTSKAYNDRLRSIK